MAVRGVELVQAGGRLVTRCLLSPRLRSSPAARALYTALYLLGKRLTEGELRRFLRRQLRPGMVVVDAGANLGYYTLQMAELVGPAGRVHAFEPDPLTRGILLRRAGAARWGNVEVHAAALGEREGTATLYCGSANRADSRLHPSHRPRTVAETCEVRVASLDELCASGAVGAVDALKVDVQGFEVAVLRGFARTLSTRPPRWLLLELSPALLRGAGASAEELWELLAAFGYEPWALDGADGPYLVEDTAAFARRWEHGYTDVWARRRGASIAPP